MIAAELLTESDRDGVLQTCPRRLHHVFELDCLALETCTEMHQRNDLVDIHIGRRRAAAFLTSAIALIIFANLHRAKAISLLKHNLYPRRLKI